MNIQLISQRWLQTAEKLSAQRHIDAIRRSLVVISPIVICGAFSTMLHHFPLPAFQDGMQYLLGSHWQAMGQAIIHASFSIMSLLFVLAISYFLAEKHPRNQLRQAHPLMVAFTALAAFIILMQPFGLAAFSGQGLGKSGLFSAIITAITVTEVFFLLCHIPFLNMKFYAEETEPLVVQAVSSTLPLLVITTACLCLKSLAASSPLPNIHAYLESAIYFLFQHIQVDLLRAVLFIILLQAFWFVGIHGNDILFPIMHDIYAPAGEANIAALAAGQNPIEIVTDALFNHFVFLGGSGTTLSLIIALLYTAKRRSTRRLAQISLLPALFNINEILLFGLPVVLNPLYLIPFVAVPLLLTCLSFIAIATGLVPPFNTTIPWTTPILSSGYLGTGSWQGPLLQLINLLLGTLLYIPFVRLAEEQKTHTMQQAFSQLAQSVNQFDTQLSPQLLTRHDSQGYIARTLAQDLRLALHNQQLQLVYQPQVNYTNELVGLEALLRWQHPVYGPIAPPLIISIAEEAGLIDAVGQWIIKQSCQQFAAWQDNGLRPQRLSINVSVLQLYHHQLPTDLSTALATYQLSPHCLEIEITEKFALSSDERVQSTLEKLHALGLRIAIDDFGMGHSSLQYIKYYPIDTLKIDRSLSHDVLDDLSYQEIIASISSLCNSLGIETIVEYVETPAQRNMLYQLGCTQYQGYLYSPPLPPQQVPAFIRQHNRLTD